MWYNRKRARRSSERAQLWIFTPHFPKFRAFEMLHSSKRHLFSEFLVENKAFQFSKRALHAGTARKKWLKKSPDYFLVVIVNLVTHITQSCAFPKYTMYQNKLHSYNLLQWVDITSKSFIHLMKRNSRNAVLDNLGSELFRILQDCSLSAFLILADHFVIFNLNPESRK